MTRPRETERDTPYIDVNKACDLYKKNNPDVKNFNIVQLHDLYLKLYPEPENYVSYQTFINWHKKGFKQLYIFERIKDIVGAKTIDELITKP